MLYFNETALSAHDAAPNTEHFMWDGRKGERMEQEADLEHGPQESAPRDGAKWVSWTLRTKDVKQSIWHVRRWY